MRNNDRPRRRTKRLLLLFDMWSSVECGGVGGGQSARAAPCARGKHSATLLGGYVYVLGGRGAGGALPLRDFWRYSLASGEWERLECRGEPPPALQEHTATAHEARLYVFGGEAGALNTETPLWSYDTETQIWRKLPGQHNYTATLRRRTPRDARAVGSPRGRRGHSAHALKDCLLVYGGYKDLRGSTNELWAFHYESESWHQVRTASAGPARHRHAAALHADRLYVHGGQCDLRDCADLWHYDTMSRVWTQVRTPAKLSPSARSGHAGLRAGAHLYIFGGEANGHPTNELWRFHFGTETWERIVQSLKWPSARVDACALLVPAPARGALPSRASAPARRDAAGFMREISKLSGFHIRRAARCSYSVLAADRDSTESLVRHEAALAKSRSAYAIDADRSPRAADTADITRDPVSVPDFAARVVPDATRLVYFDSEEEEEMRREAEREAAARRELTRGTVVAIPKSASVRFTRMPTATTDEEDAELSTSDYASAERVNRLSGASLGFSNPHYLGPDVRALGAALTPDSGVGANDIELQDLGERRARSETRAPQTHLHLLLVGGKEPPHIALLQSPISMWTYRLL
ncbi:hypothetical protein ABMA27_016325 [Loxostege sticticalis]|uniref:Tip elongation aberrant protein 1 n=1 Tax=Loxostege sticticalis TaxID=481309 RepID=A0ABR3I1T9_LOXSC